MFLDGASFYPMVGFLIYNLIIVGFFIYISLHNSTFVEVWKSGAYRHPYLPRRTVAQWMGLIFNEDTLCLSLFIPSSSTRSMELEDPRVTAILDEQLEGYLKTTEKNKLNGYCKYM
jgi:hypothetical protein